MGELAKFLVFIIVTDEVSAFGCLLHDTHNDLLVHVRFDLFKWVRFV
jgi:hypothetical protein